jgi:O-acetyl-ADP-ribose deacetylase (regulator of RNase III)
MKQIHGNLITLALQGHFDAIVHGCNCQVTMGAGIARQIADTFPGAVEADKFYDKQFDHRYNKLGTFSSTTVNQFTDENNQTVITQSFDIINAYTQFMPGPDLRLNALQMCLEKINHNYKGKKIGLPLIGCGIAGGNWDAVKQCIEAYMTDCEVTVVHFKP